MHDRPTDDIRNDDGLNDALTSDGALRNDAAILDAEEVLDETAISEDELVTHKEAISAGITGLSSAELLDDDDILTDEDVARLDPDEVSDRPEDHDVDGITPLPEELTGRASGTDEDLVALFENGTDKHMADGFRGGSDDEPPVDDDEFDEDPTQAER